MAQPTDQTPEPSLTQPLQFLTGVGPHRAADLRRLHSAGRHRNARIRPTRQRNGGRLGHRPNRIEQWQTHFVRLDSPRKPIPASRLVQPIVHAQAISSWPTRPISRQTKTYRWSISNEPSDGRLVGRRSNRRPSRAIADLSINRWYQPASNPRDRGFCSRTIHRHGARSISSGITVDTARNRLVYQELFVLQLALAIRRQRIRSQNVSPPLDMTPKIRSRIYGRLPFELTESQQSVLQEIATDMRQPFPMNRLIHGDKRSPSYCKNLVSDWGCGLGV